NPPTASGTAMSTPKLAVPDASEGTKLRPRPSMDAGPFGRLILVGSTPAARAAGVTLRAKDAASRGPRKSDHGRNVRVHMRASRTGNTTRYTSGGTQRWFPEIVPTVE